MGAVRRFLTNWWTVTIVVAVLLLLVFCVGLPLVLSWFRPWWVKLICFLVIAGGWGVLAFLHVRRAKRANDAIAAALEPSAADAESAAQAERMRGALASLKGASGNRRNYLYSRPWYVIIGPPGAGKTTALLNSGLRFPFAEQALKGIGGTRNLDFWFADEAALVDTAGRYTSQDSDAAVDAKGWQNFLSLLRKNRPLQPINGVIVAIGVDELVKGDRVAIDAHAAAVRRRLAELRRTLEVAAPVYVLLTKADLLAGFVEFHEDLDVEGRRAVLGHTFPFERGKIGADRLMAAFDAVAQTIADRQAKRLDDEPDTYRRSLILGFPAQMSALRPRLMRFLEGAFVAGDEPGGVLRGFYFTSGVQQGAPLDRMLSGMADIYDQPHAAGAGSGRAYFLNRLLTEVMFPEAGLVQHDPKALRRQRTRLTAAIAAIAGLSLLLVVLWTVSFFQNQGLQSALLAKAGEAQALTKERGIDLVKVSATDADLEQALGVLDALRALPQGYADRKAGGPPWSMTFGLFQSSHAQLADFGYREGLRRILLPRILLRLETAMRDNIADPLAVYEPLKVYLMLGGFKKDGIDAAAVRNWVNADWAANALPGADRADLRKRLGQHLDALLEDKEMASVWPERKAPLDGAVIASARAAVQTMSIADRAYAVLKQKAMTAQGAPWTATARIGSGDAPAFSNGAAVLALQVPFFFTRQGYEAAYQPGLLTVQRDLENDLWVLGEEASTATIRQQIGNVRPGVAGRYAEDYIKAWEGVVASMKPAAFFGQDLAAFGAFTKEPSPWKLILLDVRENTTFAGGTAAAKSMAAAKITSRLGSAAQLAPTASTTVDAATIITNHFKELHAYVGDGKAPAPIDQFLAAVKTAGQSVIAARSGGASGGEALQAAMASANAAVAAAAAGAPAIVKDFVGATAQGGTAAQTTAAQGAVNEAYANIVAPACRSASQDKYPFFATSPVNASALEAVQTFGMNGVVDAFVKQRLMPLLNPGPVWRWKTEDPVAANFDPGSADQFAKAGQIRDVLAGGVAFKVSVESIGPAADAVEFSSGGQSLRFDATDRSPKQMLWSPQTGVPEAHVRLFKGPAKIDEIAGDDGPWALLRLIDKANKRQNASDTSFLVTYGVGDKATTLRISLAAPQNPFARGGVWTFRCPVTL